MLELFSFAKEVDIFVQDFLSSLDMSDLFYLPLSIEAHDQFQQLVTSLHDVQLHQENDRWSYIWGSAAFTSSQAYSHLMGTVQVSPVYR
jgi:predicted transposase YbfD/YdcC